MDISKYLVAAIGLKRMTQKSLADRLNMSPAYVNKLCKGTKTPSIDLLDKICQALNMTPSEFFSCLSDKPYMQLRESEIHLIDNYRCLYGYEKEVIADMVCSLHKKHLSYIQPQSSPRSLMRSVNGYAAAGTPLFDPTIENEIEIDAIYMDPERYLLFEARGLSMSPDICDGDIVVAERGTKVTSGLALVHLEALNTDGEYTIKKIYIDNDRVELRSINPDFSTMVYPISSIISAERIVKIVHK